MKLEMKKKNTVEEMLLMHCFATSFFAFPFKLRCSHHQCKPLSRPSILFLTCLVVLWFLLDQRWFSLVLARIGMEETCDIFCTPRVAPAVRSWLIKRGETIIFQFFYDSHMGVEDITHPIDPNIHHVEYYCNFKEDEDEVRSYSI
jgi:hypothetical protein